MCGNLTLYETLKLIASIAAPAITIFSALLGLFTKTTKEVITKRKHKEITKEVFTKWAWWSLSGILLGGTISILGVFNDKKISEIESCIKASKDSVYNAKVDSVNLQLKVSRDTLAEILRSSSKTVAKLDDTYSKQLLGIEKENALLNQTEQVLHPLVPLKMYVAFQVKLPSKVDNTLQEKLKSFYYKRTHKPSYFKVDESYDNAYSISCDLYSLLDTSQLSDDYLDLRNWINSYLLPEIQEVAFFSKKNEKISFENFDSKLNVYNFFGMYPEYDKYSGRVSRYQMNNFSISFNYKSSYVDGVFILEPMSPTQLGSGADIKSLYQIKNGSIGIKLKTLKPTVDTTKVITRLKYITLQCGGIANETFDSKIFPEDMLGNKNEEMFSIPIERLIKGTAQHSFLDN